MNLSSSDFQNQKIKLVKSPLRYPGSKQKFCKTLSDILKNNSIKPKLFIEPFAGGSSVSLYMIQNNLVDNIALIEKDPLVASFWKTVFFNSEWLIKEIKKTKVTVENFKYYKKYKPTSIKYQALKCLFLNRTCFSGILKAGPIGGYNQTSSYKIDCRFNKDTLINTIETLALYKDKVLFIEQGDYKEILEKYSDSIKENSFLYFDPPYVNKAKDLYNFYFLDNDHIELKNFIQNINCNWLLSYDYEPPLNDLYKSFSNCGFFDITYTTTPNNHRPKKKEFLASNLIL